jgi:hypothetical protein
LSLRAQRGNRELCMTALYSLRLPRSFLARNDTFF